MRAELKSFEGVEEAEHLRVVELRPGFDISSEEELGEFDSFGIGEPDLADEDPELVAALLGDVDFHPVEDSDPVSAFVAALAHRCADDLDRAFMARGRCLKNSAHLDPLEASPDVMTLRSRWWNMARNDRAVSATGDRIPKREIRRVALTLCELCPVQWECVSYAIDSSAYFIWACTEEERNLLASVPDWRERVSEAQAQAVSVRRLVKSINPQETTS